jgi:hypothetical protein
MLPRVPGERQGRRVAVAAAAKAARAEATAAAARQWRKALTAKLREERRKVRDDQGGENGWRSRGSGLQRQNSARSPLPRRPDRPGARFNSIREHRRSVRSDQGTGVQGRS